MSNAAYHAIREREISRDSIFIAYEQLILLPIAKYAGPSPETNMVAVFDILAFMNISFLRACAQDLRLQISYSERLCLRTRGLHNILEKRLLNNCVCRHGSLFLGVLDLDLT